MAHAPASWLAAALLGAGAAHALELGPVEVGSALGEPLDARIPLRAAAGERFEAACFYLSHGSLGEGQRLTLALERSARGAALRIRSTSPFQLPATTLNVGFACPGREAQPVHELALLVDPRSRIRAATVGSTPAIAATIQARDDATLASIARTVIPGDAQARTAYLEALAAANPQLAAGGPDAAIAAGTPVALPDLRTFQATRRAAASGTVPLVPDAAPSAAVAPAPMAATRRSAPAKPPPVEVEPPPPPTTVASRRDRPPARLAATSAPPRPEAPKVAAPAAPPAPPARQERAPAPAAPGRREAAAEGFVLRLSTAEIDLSRSRGIDDRRRAQLRERQLILDQDDQVSALLAMRHSLRQLEARVSELQLKLSGMPASFPDRAAAPKPAPAPAAVVAAPPPPPAAMPDRPKATEPAPPAARPAPAPSAAAKAVDAPAPATPAPAAPATTPAPASAALGAATTAASPATTAASPATTPPPAPKAPSLAIGTPPPPKPAPAVAPAVKAPARAVEPRDGWNPAALLREYGAWLAGLAAVLLFALAYALWRRRKAALAAAEPATEEDDLPEVAEPAPVEGVGEIAAPVAPAPVVERASVSSDEHLPTRLRDPDAGDLRRRYIEERFPEVASRAIRLEDTDSVVKGARLFYEDGELPRAIELLQLAIEARPSEVRLWLALFEIFRLERLPGEFAQLAQRFQEQHGQSEHWRKVQFFGREVEPGNPLYREEPVNTLETIGPRETRRLAAAKADFDPIAENWLNAPMDFENEVLANDLRRALMAEAAIAEQDLLPAPRSALRNVEIFTVA